MYSKMKNTFKGPDTRMCQIPPTVELLLWAHLTQPIFPRPGRNYIGVHCQGKWDVGLISELFSVGETTLSLPRAINFNFPLQPASQEILHDTV